MRQESSEQERNDGQIDPRCDGPAHERFDTPAGSGSVSSLIGDRAIRPLRIAMIAPPWFELPPRGYGGIESVVADLVDQLRLRGHEVTLIGAGRHRTRANRFVATYETPPTELLGSSFPEVVHAAAAAAVLDELEVDVVHDHSLAGPLLARGRPVPTAITVHGPVTGSDYARLLYEFGASVDMIAISDAQRRTAPGLNWAGRVHNAVDVASFPFREHKDGYVLWLGRFSDEKAPDLAIEAARAAGHRIVLAGKVNESAERKYFDSRVRPLLGPDAEYVGEADATLKRELFAGARCLAFPIQWDEPFGMVMVEAMACGTPVVALRRGSVPEVVADGMSGLVVDDEDDFSAALDKAADLSPAACRQHAELHFDLPVMAAGYERIYALLTERQAIVDELTDGLVEDLVDAAWPPPADTLAETTRRPGEGLVEARDTATLPERRIA